MPCDIVPCFGISKLCVGRLYMVLEPVRFFCLLLLTVGSVTIAIRSIPAVDIFAFLDFPVTRGTFVLLR